MRWATQLAAACVLLLAACGGGDAGGQGRDSGEGLAEQILPAVAALESELGAPQEFFEITSTTQLVNLFVATDDGTAVVPYIYFDGDVQPPAPKQTGVSGRRFSADAIDLDADTILDGVGTDLPTATIDALSVEGGPGGSVRYVVSVRSDAGGVLDVVVAPSGAVLEVIAL